MQYSLLSLALAASAAAQGVTSAIAPTASAPAGCASSYGGAFEFQVLNVTSSGKRDLQKRGAVVATLSNGVLKDSQGRIGYIASNYQFQFDGPPAQAGAIYTAGWSLCSNGSLALGGSAIFYECLSGTYYNFYDQSIGGQCSPIYIDAVPVGSNGVVSQLSDGQPTGHPVTQISDGQLQGPTGVITQISDGQIQGPTAVITQISDGQIQGPTGVVITQISDGQIQGPTGVVITQISDGQIQGPTGPVITQISDGQIQGPTTPVAVTPTKKPLPVSGTVSSGRPSSSKNLTTPITPSQPVTGASPNAATTSATLTGGIFAVAALVLALAML